MAMKMRQSLAEFERAFVEEAWDERDRREALRRQAATRSRTRRIERQHKRGSWRFAALVLVLIATAVAVTVAMFETLYIVMGESLREFGLRRTRAGRPPSVRPASSARCRPRLADRDRSPKAQREFRAPPGSPGRPPCGRPGCRAGPESRCGPSRP